MIEHIKDNLVFYRFIGLSDQPLISHFVSSRNGGFSKSPFNSLNLGLKVGDDINLVIANRKKLASAVDIDIENFVLPSQCHTLNIRIVSVSDKGSGVFSRESALQETDALITSDKEICLVVFGADCVPVLFYDPQRQVIAVAHAGWKGTVNKIVSLVINKMKNDFLCRPEDIMASVGPSIGPCCYIIGAEVSDQVSSAFEFSDQVLMKDPDSKTVKLDLWKANILLMKKEGLTDNHIECACICTSCRNDLFFSHRCDNGTTGRFAAGIMLKK